MGTSASSPVFAGMVSLMKAAHASEGKGPVSFLNPTLYNASSAAYFNDIPSGINNCESLSDLRAFRALTIRPESLSVL